MLKLNDYVTKTAGCSYVPNTGNVEKDIKATQAALYTHGPLAVALDANKLSFRDAVVKSPTFASACKTKLISPSIRLYKSGIYYEEECSNAQLSHAVTLTGYGVNTTNLGPDHEFLIIITR